jgi:osmotically-inducible protein OsmY
MSHRTNPGKLLAACLISLAVGAAGGLAGCSSAPGTVDRAESVRKTLRAAGLNDVTVKDDLDKGVMTLSGHVASDGEKAQADSIAASVSAGLVVSNQIAVIPPGFEKRAKEVNADLDDGIDKNLDAALIHDDLHKGVSYTVKSGVVTLKGEVPSQELRTQVQLIAVRVPNVLQVVNELQVKNQKASSSN